jgi:hypothetical protein
VGEVGIEVEAREVDAESGEVWLTKGVWRMELEVCAVEVAEGVMGLVKAEVEVGAEGGWLVARAGVLVWFV